ncbi:glutamine synthetase family protein [Streptomyces sp. NPDC047024]|uniref:glutamine synthetase family protein n=1 Tax=Streptomyces sp. NPDC047024 TaxID=3155476 RepID=UPI003404C950
MQDTQLPPHPAPPTAPDQRTPRLSLNELRARADDTADPVTTVLLTVVDPHGRPKGKRYDVRYFLKVVDHPEVDDPEVEMCGYLMDTDGRNIVVPELASGWGTGYPDMRVRVDLSTLALMPGQPTTAHVFGQVTDHFGQPFGIDPHTILERQLGLLSDLGRRAMIGIETEFVLLKGTREDMARSRWSKPEPAFTRNMDYSTDPPPLVQDYLDDLSRALADTGHPLEALKLEGAPGQLEVTFPYQGDIQDACHQHIRMQSAAMQLAERAGLTAAFMAAPETGVGNGLHIHLSLWSEDEPHKSHFAGSPGDEADSELGQAIGGLLRVLPNLTPLYAPTVNAYRRFQSHSFAPTRFTWGRDNRTCAVRVVGAGANRHLEVRLAGADANPFLAVAAVIAGVVDGIASGVEPPKRVTGNSYNSTAPRVAENLGQALEIFQESRVAAEALGRDVVAHYSALGRGAIRTHARMVSDADRELFLSRS